MKYLQKSFSVIYSDSQDYRSNYDRIFRQGKEEYDKEKEKEKEETSKTDEKPD